MVDQYLQHLMALIGSNRIFASYEFMKNLPPNTPIPNKHNLFCDLEAKVNNARTLTKEINSLLKKAAYPKALDNLLRAKRLVPDFPNIQNDIDFIEGTIANSQQSLIDAELAAQKGQEKKVREFLDTATKIDGQNIAITSINKKLQKSMRRKKAKNILVTTLVILTPFMYWGYEQLSFMKSNTLWNQANFYISNQECQLAKLEMEKVEEQLKKVIFFNQIDKARLLTCVTNMIESTRFQQGLLGKVIHNGQYIAWSTKQQLDLIATHSELAKHNIDEQQWPEALASYQKALKIALEDEEYHQAAVEELQKTIMLIRDDMYAQYKEEGRASFMVMVRQADILFTEKRWSEAMDSYGNALRFAQENRVSDYDVVTRISSARHEAEINNCLEDAQALLAVNKDGEARNIFEKIITLSEENGVIDLAATAISREMIGKIDKNNFLVKINSLEEKAGKLRFEKKYEEALAYYQEMLAELAANAPKFQVNPASRKAMVKAAMAEINNQKVVSNQQSYLLSMYQNILRKNFNLSTNIQLKQPEVVFLKNENNVLIYKVTALGITDSNASVPQTRYEVDYKFDLGTGAWAIDADSAS
jgi:tetratricopeptide (TPR) repeat protein